MKYKIEITNITTVEEIEEYWKKEDYVSLLEKFDYPDASDAEKDSLRELLFMAITDFEPKEAAVILLEYKLSDRLSEGQIQQVSIDMLIDKVCEEYREIGLHSTLFHINQLLFKAFNGKFPNAKATIFECSCKPLDGENEAQLAKENILKLLSNGLSESNIIKRLFDHAMHDNAPFPEAEDILWDLETTDNVNFKLTTSEYWLNKEDIVASEFEGELQPVTEEV
jgi:hypothetical protein